MTCGLGGLAPGASQTVTIQARVNAAAQGTTSTTPRRCTGNEPDPVTANDSDTEPTTVIAAER